jgi:hypothetical protein
MKNSSQKVDQNIEKDFSKDTQQESFDVFRRILSDNDIRKIEEEIKDIEVPPFSKRHKRRMNRLFREYVGGSYVPYPDDEDL